MCVQSTEKDDSKDEKVEVVSIEVFEQLKTVNSKCEGEVCIKVNRLNSKYPTPGSKAAVFHV